MSEPQWQYVERTLYPLRVLVAPPLWKFWARPTEEQVTARVGFNYKGEHPPRVQLVNNGWDIAFGYTIDRAKLTPEYKMHSSLVDDFYYAITMPGSTREYEPWLRRLRVACSYELGKLFRRKWAVSGGRSMARPSRNVVSRIWMG